MTERDFQAEVARSIPWSAEQVGRPLHYCKIPDLPRGPEQRFSPRRGYDCFLVDRGRHVALELKMSKGMSLAFGALDAYQEHCLHEVEAAGGAAWLLVCFRVTFSESEARRRGAAKAILAFAVPAWTWPVLRAEACRASLPLSWFEEAAIALPRLRLASGIAWDLRPLLKAVVPAHRLPAYQQRIVGQQGVDLRAWIEKEIG